MTETLFREAMIDLGQQAETQDRYVVAAWRESRDEETVSLDNYDTVSIWIGERRKDYEFFSIHSRHTRVIQPGHVEIARANWNVLKPGDMVFIRGTHRGEVCYYGPFWVKPNKILENILDKIWMQLSDRDLVQFVPRVGQGSTP
jgi:hypothetical protein